METGGIQVTLPGGAGIGGPMQRDAEFRPLTGHRERMLLDSMHVENRPAWVSTVLGECLGSVGGVEANRAMVASLCVADRQYLMLRLSATISGEQVWVHHRCVSCGALFDISVDRSALPVKEAGPGYPASRVRLGDMELNVRVPTGADQEQIAGLAQDEAVRVLLMNCLLDSEGKEVTGEFIAGLSGGDIGKIEQVMEEMSPEIGTRLATSCPECEKEQTVDIDPYDVTGEGGTERLYGEVHELAIHYHWGEEEILSLPRQRRRFYLRLIDSYRNMHS